jgi:hypothetical protein
LLPQFPVQLTFPLQLPDCPPKPYC